ncbi:cell division protein FtsQ [Albidovulum inexpectatum]|uniref:Cell division protein FtsQ n=1 Tax=Albidovulum inexpectatum TaxID=196587 RepID=A0A2S5JF79_9RHOB|nr:cell division protein FtsQ/DivIB [Albidovulum inexpectatum]PPB80147.1 cell division protein FtsQ [Albidovulum inexpectatum]
MRALKSLVSMLSAPRVPRDPAPSRLAYRMERLWLTPAFRHAVRVGMPVMAVLMAGIVWLSDADRREAMSARLSELRESFENRPEFMVGLIAVEGASPAVDSAIRQMVPFQLPVSSFRLDLDALRARIERIDAVARAELAIRKGGVLQVQITERQPVILWRTAGGLEMLDETGHRVATLLDRTARPDLPVITGEGADAHVPEALAILRAARPIAARIRGLVRVGERRWDIVLDGDRRILLPQDGAIEAVRRVVAIDRAEDLLGRAISVVDLRNPGRPTLRLAPERVAQFTSSDVEVTGQ